MWASCGSRFSSPVRAPTLRWAVLGSILWAACGSSPAAPRPEELTPAEEAPDEPTSSALVPPEEAPGPAQPSAAEEATAVPVAPRRYLVAAVGDSLTDARSRGGRYLAFLRERCPQSVFENFGRGGDMVNMMRRRFESDLLPRLAEFTHLLIFGGVNDLYSDLSAGRTPARVEADLTFMYDAAHARDLRVVALTVAPWGGFRRYYNERRGAATRELNDWIRAAEARGAVDHVVDAYALLSCGDPEVLCPELMRPSRDGLHFGPRGHEVLGEALYRDVFADCL